MKERCEMHDPIISGTPNRLNLETARMHNNHKASQFLTHVPQRRRRD